MDYPISFPGLDLSFDIPRTAFEILGREVYWYGIIIAAGLAIALLYAVFRSGKFGITLDDLIDVVIYGIIFGVIGSRLYYILFYNYSAEGYVANPFFTNPALILRVWEGGLGIYGGIIAAFIAAFIACRIKKINVGALFDLASLGFLIGQAVGRWGNFFNREAYGSATDLPWRMVVDNSAIGYHPCFLYESLWCLLGFLVLHFYAKRRKFDGEIFLLYLMWYGLGRFFIEALRSDSLMIGNIRVSQLVAAVLFVASAALYITLRARIRRQRKEVASPFHSVLGEDEAGTESLLEDSESEYYDLTEPSEADALGGAGEDGATGTDNGFEESENEYYYLLGPSGSDDLDSDGQNGEKPEE
jgi:phosphatidylglycerol:prolipoprotein diacylglycerol transferase